MQAVSMQQPICKSSPQMLPVGRSLRHRVSCRGSVTPMVHSMLGRTPSSTHFSSHRTPFLGASTLSSSAAFQSTSCKDRASTIVARAQQGPDIQDRLAGAVPYLIPLFDGLKYGTQIHPCIIMLYAKSLHSFRHSVLSRSWDTIFPILRQIIGPLNPLIQLYFGFPFSSLIFFFAIYLGIIQNQRFGRFARFNGMQAILLDIILIFPGLLERTFHPPSGGFGLDIYINLYNSIFLFTFVSCAYAVGSCLLGQVARLPIVADAADQQVP